MTDSETLDAMRLVHGELVERKELDRRWKRIIKRILLVMCAGGAVSALFGYHLILGNRDISRDTQTRFAEASKDNIRASIAVGSCLRANAPDVEACALAKFAELNAKADEQRADSQP